MAKGEFDDLFDDVPEKAPAKAKPAAAPASAAAPEDTVGEESPESKSAKARTLRQKGSEFEGLFGDEDTPPPEKIGIDPKILGAAGAGALGGALYGASKKPVPSEVSLAARLMERYYGLPSGALTTFEGALPTPVNEASMIAARTIVPPPPAFSPTTAGAQTELTPEQVARILQGGESDTRGTTGRARQTGYNIQTAQEAAIKALMGAGMSELDAQAYLAKLPGLTSTSSGVIVPRSTSVPTAGPRTQPDVWKRERAIGPVPWTGDVQPPPLGGMGATRPGTAPAPVAPVAPAAPAAPVEPTPQRQPTVEETAAKIRAASARAHALQRGSNVAVRGLFGAPLAAQAYGMATQEEPIDWQQLLSLGGGALGTFGPLTSKIPKVARRVPVAGPLAALAQLPYAIKHREEIARQMTLPDVVGDPNILTGSEMFEKLPLFHMDKR